MSNWTNEATSVAAMMTQNVVERPWRGAQHYVSDSGLVTVESRNGMAVWFLDGADISKADAVRLIEARMLSHLAA